MNLEELLLKLEGERGTLTRELRQGEQQQALHALWRYPGVRVDNLENLEKDERLHDYLDLAQTIHRFRERVTEQAVVTLPRLGRLLEDVGRILSRRRHVTPLLTERFNAFLERVEPLTDYEREEEGLRFYRVDEEKKAFIVSDGFLRNFLLYYDLIRSDVLPFYRAAAADADHLLFLTKEYGPTGPVKDREAFATPHTIYHCLGQEPFTPSEGPTPEHLCILADLILSGNGLATAYQRYTQRFGTPAQTTAVVLTAEPDGAQHLKSLGVTIKEAYPYKDFSDVFKPHTYPAQWGVAKRSPSVFPALVRTVNLMLGAYRQP